MFFTERAAYNAV